MTRLPAIFLDDGGVLNDNSLRGPQWQRLVGEFFTPILGGDRESWARANRLVMIEILEPSGWSLRLRSAPDYAAFYRQYLLDWLGGMCTLVGVAALPDDEALALAERAERSIWPQVRAAFPGAAETVRRLHASSYRLCTASGGSSEFLDDLLRGMQIRECFEQLYGPDRIETFKIGPEFYRRIFADVGIQAEDCLVVDDGALALGWAAEAGAKTVLVGKTAGSPASDFAIGSVCELPELLTALDGQAR